MRLRWSAGLALGCALALGWLAGDARAGNFNVLVGYSDGLRGPGFFPNPWKGDPGVVFVGTDPTYDAGAVRIDNTDSVAHSYHVVVDLNRPGPAFDLWGNVFVPAGDKLVLTQTAYFNFDTSDFPIEPTGTIAPPNFDPPLVMVSVDGGAAQTFKDTGHVLDTNGFDYAAIGNESFAWRPIGGNGAPSGGPSVPEPGTLALGGLGLLALAGYTWRRRKLAS
jgi:hypothetical protein